MTLAVVLPWFIACFFRCFAAEGPMRTSLQGPSVPVHPTGLLRRVRPRIASSGDASSSPGQGNLLLGMRCPYRHFFVELSSGRHCTGFNLNTVHKLSSKEKNLGAAGIRIRGCWVGSKNAWMLPLCNAAPIDINTWTALLLQCSSGQVLCAVSLSRFPLFKALIGRSQLALCICLSIRVSYPC